MHVPFCGLAVLEALTGVETGVEDPVNISVGESPTRAMTVWQHDVIEQSAALARALGMVVEWAPQVNEDLGLASQLERCGGAGAPQYAGHVVRRPVTIVDIARELGISKTTVSAALHGSGRVSETTRVQVEHAAERLGYVSNRAAQTLRGSRSQSIGLHLFPNSQARNFYMQFVFR